MVELWFSCRWPEFGWFSRGAELVQIGVWFGSVVVQHGFSCGWPAFSWFSLGSACCGHWLYSLACCSLMFYGLALVQIGFTVGSDGCGMRFDGQAWAQWPEFTWFNIGSALVQLV